jgi:hypothetical protein
MAALRPIAGMFETAPSAWWIYVPCGYCRADRRQPCRAMDGPARGPHAQRLRHARVLHSTLWLITYDGGKFASDVLGDP